MFSADKREKMCCLSSFTGARFTSDDLWHKGSINPETITSVIYIFATSNPPHDTHTKAFTEVLAASLQSAQPSSK